MFTNPLNRKYQTGGSTPTDDQKKDMQEFVTWIKSNVEGFKDKSEQEIAKSLSDMAKSDEGKKSVQNLYSRYQKSKKQKSKFADGGKFQSFICKHGHGGVNCGCGGGKVVRGAEGIDDIPTPKDSTVTSNGYVIYKPSVREVAPNGESVVITYGHDPNGQWARRMEWANGGTSILGGYNNNGKWVSEGDVTYDPTSEFAKAFLSPRARMSRYEDRPQSKEDGGVVMGKDGLSRKQVRRDKREVLRIMNRPTAGAQYEDLMYKSRNWDRFAGMSRLERKNAINQLILNGEKPVVQTPIQPDRGENYVINETTVPYQFFNPTPQIVETPKASVAQRSTSTNRRSDIAKPEDFPMQEIVIPQMSTNIPFDNGSRTTSSNNSTTIATPEQEPAPVFINGKFVNASLPVTTESNSTSTTPTVIDWSKASAWDPYIRMNNGPLSTYQMNLIRTLYENPNATIDDMAGGRRTWTQEAFDLNKRKFGFKQGGQIEKHQDANGKIATSNVTPVGKVTQIRFPKILFGPGHNTVSFKSDDGLVHTWTRYDDGIYVYNSSPSNITKIYSPKAKETKNVRDGLKHTTITYPIDSTLTQKVDALIDDNTKWWE